MGCWSNQGSAYPHHKEAMLKLSTAEAKKAFCFKWLDTYYADNFKAPLFLFATAGWFYCINNDKISHFLKFEKRKS